jgi:hypothetical protein
MTRKTALPFLPSYRHFFNDYIIRPLSGPKTPYCIVVKGWIAAQNRNVLGLALGNDYAIEGVLMMKRERCQHIYMVGQNPEQRYRISVHVLRHEVREREGECEPAQTGFDSHFPKAGDTEQPFISTVLDELACVETKGRITTNKPEKGVRIE